MPKSVRVTLRISTDPVRTLSKLIVSILIFAPHDQYSTGRLQAILKGQVNDIKIRKKKDYFSAITD
jgi:hypothetical protein